MKFSNFRDYQETALGVKRAKVDVTTGKWFWKKTVTREVGALAIYWRFLDTGEYVPQCQLDALHTKYVIESAFAYEKRLGG